ncbi:MAG: exonuclease domain-containing protein [Crocinitomicaceae bacterium]|jgi:DNA polymerase-3 subunit epsilon
MNLLLTKPLCVFDLETTGTQITKDRIVQIAIIKLLPNGEQQEYNQLINPTIVITDEIALIHGITNERVKNSPTFREKAEEIADFIGDSDLAGYNSNKFDIPVLAEEFLRAEFEFDISNRRFIDVQNIFHKMEQRTLAAAYQFYCDKKIENAHDALYDTRATLDVFVAQLDRYKELKNDVTFLSEFSRAGEFELIDLAGRLAKNKKGEVIYNFGKHNGKSIAEVMKIEPGYYGWMLDADFPLYTKQCLRNEMQRIKENASNSNSLEDKLNQLKNKFNSK